MNAYAILDGGGVKGAALVGCLKAAQQQGVTFAGYGGTSAGAIVATLAAVGYTADELRSLMVDEIKFSEFIADAAPQLEALRRLAEKVTLNPTLLLRGATSIWRLSRQLGLSNGLALTEFVRTKIVQKMPALRNEKDITFLQLRQNGGKPLKIVVTDLRSRKPRIYSSEGGEEHNGSVLNAVRASASYPFVFRPVSAGAAEYFVDGGLCSNLPIFLFDKEREGDGLPVIAFDLVSTGPPREGAYTFARFCKEMLDTALESGDYLLRKVTSGVHHVLVPVPSSISTLDFGMSREQSEVLYNAGMAAAHAFFTTTVPQWAQAGNLVEMLQARMGVRPSLVIPVLRAAVNDFQDRTRARSVRANVMLPTPAGTRIVVYQYGMDNDPDSDLELGMTAGCSGRAWATRRPVAADLEAARENYLSEWGMTREQQTKVRQDRKAMFSFPMFDIGNAQQSFTNLEELRLLGLLSVDTDSSLEETGWVQDLKEASLAVGKQWADILARLLT